MTDLSELTITDVRAVELRGVPFSEGLIPPWNPRERITSRDYLVVRVETNQGIWGLSMDGEYTPRLPATVKGIQDVVAPYLIGKPVVELESHTEFFHRARTHGRFFFIAVALWDIIGKALNMPLYKLWGGKRDKVRVYASTVQHGRSPEQRAEDCKRLAGQGYKGVKLRLSAETIAGDMTLVQTCHLAVGDQVAIMLDANQAGKVPGSGAPGVTWDPSRAETTTRLLAKLNVAFLEEPLAYQLVDEGIALRQASEVPIAGGEGKVGIRAFGKLLEEGVYDILQPDPITGGTPSDMLKIRAAAEAAGVPVIYHHGKSGVGFVIGLHLSAAFGDSPWLEYMDDGPFWTPRGFQVGFREVIPVDEDGCVRCPDTPGLGVDWDPKWLQEIGLD
jgi:L-alanine-DL-glutamate epimerase-like enolase superfamily enzyme